jgi:hypothetical protein
MSRVLITPVMANEMLGKNADNQRKVNKARVEKYAIEMRNGMWLYNGESIIVTENGRLIDGQHRLLAVLESNVSIEVSLVDDVPDDQDGVDTFLTINSENRSNADALHISGMKIESSKIAKLVSLVQTFNFGKLRSKPSGLKFSNPAIVEMAKGYGETNARVIIDRASTLQKRFPLLSLNYWLLLVHIFDKNQTGKTFLEELSLGRADEEGSPISALVKHLRTYDGKGGSSAITKIKWIAIFKAYKFYESGKEVHSIRVNVGMPFEYPKDYEDYEFEIK